MIDVAPLWEAGWFAALDPSAKLLYLHLLTHPRASALGLLRSDERAVAAETGLARSAVGEALAALGPDEVRRLPAARGGGWWVRRRIALAPPRSAADVRAWARDLGSLPPGPLRRAVALEAGRVGVTLRDDLFLLVPDEALSAVAPEMAARRAGA